MEICKAPTLLLKRSTFSVHNIIIVRAQNRSNFQICRREGPFLIIIHNVSIELISGLHKLIALYKSIQHFQCSVRKNIKGK